MAIQLNEKDVADLESAHPYLYHSKRFNTVSGTLNFKSTYVRDEQRVKLISDSKEAIEDQYEIEIRLNVLDDFNMPKVYETEGKIKSFVKREGIRCEDLHLNDKSGSCCLGIFLEFKWKGILCFIDEMVIPFFYWQSHRRIRGVEPWPCHAHFNEGLIKQLVLPISENMDRYINKPCPCGSEKKYKHCHYKTDEKLRAMSSLKEYSVRSIARDLVREKFKVKPNYGELGKGLK